MTTTNHDYSDETLFNIAKEVAGQDFSAAITADDGTTPGPDYSGEPMVGRSIRLPIEVHQRLTDAAKAAGIPASTLIRQAIEAHLTALEDDQPVSRADVLRVIGMLRPVRRNTGGTIPHAA